ncbi:MAG: hypothetical protein IJG63_05895 [Oscillospiraceae bacterium]|nr:hypothetical protein [Oscillospiraceae bacterium]
MNNTILKKAITLLLLLSMLLLSGCSSGYGGIFDRRENTIKKDEVQPASQAHSDTSGAEEAIPELDLKLESRSTWQYMNEQERALYRTLADTIGRHEPESADIDADDDTLHRVMKYICCDFPEFFWFGGEYTIYTKTLAKKVLSRHVEFKYSIDDIDTAASEIEDIAAGIISGIDPSAGEYDKVKYVFDYIINSTDYDTGLSSEQSMYSVLTQGRGVCAGYSKATQFLLNRLGLQCAYITGTAEGQRHAWNLVKVNGEYYYLDTTWGEQSFNNTDLGTAPYYALFCCSSEELFRTHTLDGDIPVPVCTAVSANYYARNGLLFDSYDYVQSLRALENAACAGLDFTVKYTNAAAYQTALDSIIEQGEISQMFRDMKSDLGYSPDSGSIMYYHDDIYNILTVFLNPQEGQNDQG